MRIIKYIKEEYRGWLIGLLLAPFVIAFGKFFTEFNSTIEFSNLTTVILNILCLTFCVSFMIFIIISGEFEFHEMTGCTEYEPEDLDKFKRNLKKTLTVYSIALLIWVVAFLSIILEYGKTGSIWKMIYLLTFPLVFIGLMIYIFNRIKTAYNNVYN